MTATEPDRCAALDARDGFHPGTSAMLLLTGDIVYRQARMPTRWVAEPRDPIDELGDGRLHRAVRGEGATTEVAMADLWTKASAAEKLRVWKAASGPLDVRWDPARGWCDPERVPS